MGVTAPPFMLRPHPRTPSQLPQHPQPGPTQPQPPPPAPTLGVIFGMSLLFNVRVNSNKCVLGASESGEPLEAGGIWVILCFFGMFFPF